MGVVRSIQTTRTIWNYKIRPDDGDYFQVCSLEKTNVIWLTKEGDAINAEKGINKEDNLLEGQVEETESHKV